MASINTYLNFPGNTEEAFDFYKSVFGGEFVTVMRFKETAEAAKTKKEDLNKIMHIALPIGNNILMGTDTIEGGMGFPLNAGNNFSLSIGTASQSEADKIYKGLSTGGQATVLMSKTFWGAYFGMLVDKFGIQWMVSFDENVTKQ